MTSSYARPRRHRGALALGCLALAAAANRAAAQPASSPAAPAHFAPMAFLAESCWKGAFPDNVATDEHCFTWVYGKQFLRDKHIVRNGKTPYEGETMYALDVAAKQVSYIYWSSDGNTMRGAVESRGDSLIFPTRFDTPKGPIEIKAVWTRLGPDRYRVWQAQKVGDAWKPMMTMELTRSGAAK